MVNEYRQEASEQARRELKALLDIPLPSFLRPRAKTWEWGWLVRPGSCWVGFHWSKANQRLCINLVPFITLWIVKPGGLTP